MPQFSKLLRPSFYHKTYCNYRNLLSFGQFDRSPISTLARGERSDRNFQLKTQLPNNLQIAADGLDPTIDPPVS
ncbi:MAG: hypothetical protein HC895_20270, partial [Leptolyngbyaceae cyanobacterium SM1_3_5]|nr:hypothetical protein [Leptolyngbyaceae cyanobacterium SM1_3_5]